MWSKRRRLQEGITLTKKRNYKGKAGKIKVLCPECKEASTGKLKYYPERDSAYEHYFCSVCRNQWDMTEVLTEEYKTATFIGDDGEWKFIQHSKSNKERLKRDTNMWNPKQLQSNRQRRRNKGNQAGGMTRKDINMLRRLRK